MKTATPNPGATLTERIIRLGIKAHRKLCSGLLESIYNQCLCLEVHHDGLAFKREVPLPTIYEDLRLDRAYRADIGANADWYQTRTR
jgi:GxxExxY protein